MSKRKGANHTLIPISYSSNNSVNPDFINSGVQCRSNTYISVSFNATFFKPDSIDLAMCGIILTSASIYDSSIPLCMIV